MATWDFDRIEPQEDVYQYMWGATEDEDWSSNDLDNIGWDDWDEPLSSQQSQHPRQSRTTNNSFEPQSSSPVGGNTPPRNTLDRPHSHANLGTLPPAHELLLSPATQLLPHYQLDRRQPAPSNERASRQQVTSTRTARPPPSHREDWLDRSATNHASHFSYIPDGLFERLSDSELTPDSDRQSRTPPSESLDEFVTLEDSDDASEAADMAPATRRRNPADRSSSVVDLTSGTSPPDAMQEQPRGSKRAAEGSSAGRAAKRGKLSEEKIEEIDLANEAPSAEEELRQQQQQEAIRSQQAAEEDGAPQRIGKRQCIICMESYTNATATACGHFYCHECLIQALLAGEKNSDRATGTCPVCRKPLSRTNKKKYDVIPISFMKKSQFAKNQSMRTDLTSSQRSRAY